MKQTFILLFLSFNIWAQKSTISLPRSTPEAEGVSSEAILNFVESAKNNRTNLPPFKVAGSYTWKDDKTLELTIRYIESPHTETIVCTFEGNSVALDFQNLMNKNQKRELIKGDIKQ